MCTFVRLGQTGAWCFVVASMAALTPSAMAIMAGQRDSFSSADTAGWSGGSMTGVIGDGGPLGAGDAFFRVVADGAGPNGKMTTYNRTERWLGNYTGAGVGRIEMDLRNFSTQPLTIRLGIKMFTGQSVPGYVTSNARAFVLPADGQWHHAGFNITEADMVGVNGPFLPLSDLLVGGVNAFQELRILHSVNPTLQGDNLSASMGIDNIAAVPAPTAGLLTAAFAAGLASRRRRLG